MIFIVGSPKKVKKGEFIENYKKCIENQEYVKALKLVVNYVSETKEGKVKNIFPGIEGVYKNLINRLKNSEEKSIFEFEKEIGIINFLGNATDLKNQDIEKLIKKFCKKRIRWLMKTLDQNPENIYDTIEEIRKIVEYGGNKWPKKLIEIEKKLRNKEYLSIIGKR